MGAGTTWEPRVSVEQHAPGSVERVGDAGSLPTRGGVERQRLGRSLRILMVAPEAPPIRSGVASVVGYLERGLQTRGHELEVLAYPSVGRLAFGEVRLSSLILRIPGLLRRLKDYDVVHIHGATPTVSDIALLAAGGRGRRAVVIYTHHMDLAFASDMIVARAYNRLHRRLAARADAVVATTRDSLKLFDARSEGLVIPLGVDVEHFKTSAQKDARFTVLFIGQFRPYKGVPVLLHAMSRVSGGRLLLAGRGPEERAYRALAAKLGVDVEFHVDIDDDELRHLYRRAHVVVLPAVSRREAFGLVLLEGMSAGCVPIASNLPGVREVVAQSGFVFPKGDAARLGAILSGLSHNPILRRHLAECARARAATFSREQTVGEYERLISGLVACHELNDRLAHPTQSPSSALEKFVADVADNVQADWTELILGASQSEACTVASTGTTTLANDRQLRRASSMVAWYAINTAASTLVGPDDGPLHLGKTGIGGERPAAAMVAPLMVRGAPFGALLSIREQPFNDHDLGNLACFARAVTPSLRAHLLRKSIFRRTGGLLLERLVPGRYRLGLK